MHLAGVLIAAAAICIGAVCPANSENEVHHLDLDARAHFTSDARVGFRTDTLRIFCYAGQPKRIEHTFRTVRLRLQLAPGTGGAGTDADLSQQFTQYVGTSPADVRAHYDAKRSLFSWSHLLGAATQLARPADVRVAAFNRTCVGIETAQPYTVRLHAVRLDALRCGLFVAGVLLFGSAHRLTRMPLFYYSSGVGLGVTLSVFLVVWLVGRQLPKRSLALGTIVGGWALLWYVAAMAWENARSLLVQHQMWVFYWVGAASLVSFVACYRVGPPTNQRSIDIVRWSLQCAAAALIYASSEFVEVTVAVVLALTLWYYLPWRWCGWLRAAWLRRFPPRRRLLTVAEYEEEGRENTRKELAKMMAYCGSPVARPWETVSRLKDPKRFAEFVERGVHVTEEEEFDHTHSVLAEAEAEWDSEQEEEEVDEAAAAAANAPEISDDDDDDDEDVDGDDEPPRFAAAAPTYGWSVPPAGRALANGRAGNSSRGVRAADLVEISSDDE